MDLPTLIAKVTEAEPFFFDKKTMRFFGDTRSNYGVRGPLEFKSNIGEEVIVYELFRRKAVKHGLKNSAFFRADTFARTWGTVIE